MLKFFLLENAPLTGIIAAVVISAVYCALGIFFVLERYHLWLIIGTIQVSAGFLTGLLIKKLLHQSLTDPLTGCYNRRFFYHQLEREHDRFYRQGILFSLAMIDLDDFKTVNDRLGHIAGDRVLRTVSEIMKKSLRKTDVISRWGGEEFAVILSGTGTEDAKICIERVRSQIEETAVPAPGLNLTISVGIACVAEGMKIQDLIMAADSAMYCAKKLKNKVVVFSEIPDDMPSSCE
ncbi:MAG TPA: GGDEF domain-containing protein [Bacillota bacterium]|nr:GGDEF domain-containing protein [Bacillota bacterium]